MHEVSSPSGEALCFQCTKQTHRLVTEKRERREGASEKAETAEGLVQRKDTTTQEDERSLLCSVKTLRFQLFFCPSSQPRDMM